MADQLPPPVTQLVKQVGNVKVHTFISPDMFLANATHVIEGPNELVLVDGQFVVPYAMQFRGFADSLGKPINRVYLSHDHVDHFFGIGAAFDDVDVYALPETIDILERTGESLRQARAAEYGPMVADKVVIPGHEAKPGKEVIDGVTYEVIKYTNAETDFALGLRLPELGISITQDLLYSGKHLYFTKHADHWISLLEGFRASEYETFLPGHGSPADKNEIARNIDYLKTAKKAFADAKGDAEAYKASLLKTYPDLPGAVVIDFYTHYLFS
jgi:glyoxylase-like metal-dependent hydrolase (beta-lactamase superfamily II)